MAKIEDNTCSTCERLLDSACEVFAAKGYRDATVAEICQAADANIAAVNYHFGGKERLYAEAWRLAFQRSVEAHPVDGGVSDDAPVNQRLRGRIMAIMQRIIDPACHDFAIIHRELASPTGLLAEVMRESIGPLQQCMAELVRELLGDDATDRQVNLCKTSIIAQCFHMMLHKRHTQAIGSGPGCNCEEQPDMSIEEIADHITQFSLAGIADMRQSDDTFEETSNEG